MVKENEKEKEKVKQHHRHQQVRPREKVELKAHKNGTSAHVASLRSHKGDAKESDQNASVSDEYFLQHCGIMNAIQFSLEFILIKFSTEKNVANSQQIHSWAVDALEIYYMDWQDKEQKENKQRQNNLSSAHQPANKVIISTKSTPKKDHSTIPKKYFLTEMKIPSPSKIDPNNKSPKSDSSNTEGQKLFQKVHGEKSKHIHKPSPPTNLPPARKTTLRRNLSLPETSPSEKTVAPSLPPINNVSRPTTAMRAEALKTLSSTPLTLGCRIDEMGGVGVKILEVSDNSPAAIGGIKMGDILLALQEKKITDRPTFESVLFSFLPGQTVRALLMRDDLELDFPVTLGGRGAQTSEMQRLYLLAQAESEERPPQAKPASVSNKRKPKSPEKTNRRLTPLNAPVESNPFNDSATFEEEGYKTNRSIAEEIVHEA